jgi:hypothetical protein
MNNTQVAHTLAALSIHAPALAFETIWEEDPDCEREFRELSKPGNCFEGEDRDDWQPWQSEVRVSAIVAGQIVTGSGYLGGTWEKYGDNPAESNPDISGYFWDKASEALDEIEASIPKKTGSLTHYRDLREQIDRARQVLAGNLD